MKIFECGDPNMDSMTVLSYSDGMLEFKIDSRWCGSSETGFGADLEYSITRESAIQLRDALSAWITGQEQVAQS